MEERDVKDSDIITFHLYSVRNRSLRLVASRNELRWLAGIFYIQLLNGLPFLTLYYINVNAYRAFATRDCASCSKNEKLAIFCVFVIKIFKGCPLHVS